MGDITMEKVKYNCKHHNLNPQMKVLSTTINRVKLLASKECGTQCALMIHLI